MEAWKGYDTYIYIILYDCCDSLFGAFDVMPLSDTPLYHPDAESQEKMAKERTVKERRERTVRERAKTKARAASSSNAHRQCLEQSPMGTSLLWTLAGKGKLKNEFKGSSKALAWLLVKILSITSQT